MVFRTRSGRTYSYDPMSNRITPGTDMGASTSHTDFGRSEDYDFSRIGMYTLEVTQDCNLRCRYCCYSGEYPGRRRHNALKMTDGMMMKAVEFMKTHSGDRELLPVSFYGGEALLAKDMIRKAISLLRTELPQKDFEFSISTNGLLLTPENIEWICRTPALNVTITIDGSRSRHDRNRVMATGQGSFDTIYRNLEQFASNYPSEYASRVKFISTVKSISDLPDLNDFWMSDPLLRDHRPQHITCIIPNFSRGERVDADREKFKKVYDTALRHKKEGREDVLTDELDRLLRGIRQRGFGLLPSRLEMSTCLNKPESAFLTADGEIYVCERLRGELNIGEIGKGIDLNKVRGLNDRYMRLKETHCGHCWARRLCRRCAVALNDTEEVFLQYCENERMQLELALTYYCELLENKYLRTNE